MFKSEAAQELNWDDLWGRFRLGPINIEGDLFKDPLLYYYDSTIFTSEPRTVIIDKALLTPLSVCRGVVQYLHDDNDF